MQRRVVLSFVSLLMLCLVTQPAWSAGSRKATVEYHGTASVTIPGIFQGGMCHLVVPRPSEIDSLFDICMGVETQRDENFLSVRVKDDLGGKLPVALRQEGFGVFHNFCGKTRGRIPIPYPGEPVYLYVTHGTCDGQTSFASKGEATFTFTR